MSRAPAMSTTSYAILGLLAIKPWTTHELVRQVRLSLHRIWPRTQSKLYEEPKKLVAHGYARAHEESVGRRQRTRYQITAKGRRALAQWVAQPGAGPALEFEQLVKIHLSESGGTQAVRANLQAALEWAVTQNEDNLAVARRYRDATGTFPERTALNTLGGRFLTDFYALVADWARWGLELTESWPDDPRKAPVDAGELAAIVAIAERIATLRPAE